MSTMEAPQTGICWLVLAHHRHGTTLHHVRASSRRGARRLAREVAMDAVRLTYTAICPDHQEEPCDRN